MSILYPQPQNRHEQNRRLASDSHSGAKKDLVRSNLNPGVQRELLPHHENLLLLPPPPGVHLLEIKLPEQIRQDQPHLQVREVAAEAVAGPEGEGVEGGPWGAGFGRLVGRGEPAVRVEFGGGVGEVEGGVVGGVAGAGDEGLVGW